MSREPGSFPLRSSPLLLPLLRAVALLVSIEAIFDRLLPPRGAALAGIAGSWLDAAVQAGEFVFVPAFALVTACLAMIAAGILRRPAWPEGLNGFVASSLLCLVLMALVALGPSGGPLFVLGFTGLSLITLCTLSMHAFAGSGSVYVRAFAVAYSAAVTCSFLGQTMLLAAPRGAAGVLADGPVARLLSAWEVAWGAGRVLLVLSAALCFLAWGDLGERADSRRRSIWALPVSLAAAAGYLWIRLSTLSSTSAASGRGQVWIEVLLGAAVLLGGLTVLGRLMDQPQRGTGFGLLFLMLAGFPLRIAHQQLVMVLGATLLFFPPEAASPPPRYMPEEELPPRDPALREDPSVST